MNCCDNFCFGLFPTKMDSPQKVEISYEEGSQLQCGNAEKVGGLFDKNSNELKAWLVSRWKFSTGCQKKKSC